MNAASSEIAAGTTTIPPQTTTTAAYHFLPSSRKAELNHINSRLNEIELEEEQHQHHQQRQHDRFAAPSDISTISNCTVRTQCGSKNKQQQNGLVHSTPKLSDNLLGERNAGNMKLQRDDGVLSEIDNFLEDRRYVGDGRWNYHSDDYCLRQQQLESLSMQEAQAISLPETLNQLEHERSPHVHFNGYENVMPRERTERAANDSNLISLSEIWGKSGQATAIACTSNSTLKEEQLRRQHLEKTVHLLQSRLLEYQQRLSVAIEVDRAKDAALNNVQAECKHLNAELQPLRDVYFRLETAERSFNNKLDVLQKELAQAVSVAAKFQDKNEKLETDLEACSRQNSECNNMYKQQVEELEIRMHACKRSEEFSNVELNKLKDRLAKAEYQCDKLKLHCDEMEKEITALRHQKETLQELHTKQKSRADAMETQKKALQDTIGHLTETEAGLKKKMELQQKSLKSHYQQQLENVVAKKLKEFQEQLDKSEETLKTEARERERLIAERAVKQLELINEKCQLELNLLQEKHNEEISLYRIQLANASKKIDDLELKLNNYKSKRADIAEKLHDVMETQWQKALEILTSPNQLQQLRSYETEAASPDNNETHHNKMNGDYETPKTSKLKKVNLNENNLNLPSHKAQTINSNQPPAPPQIDRLQAYIELLLSKSPSDFDKLDEILALSSSKHKNSNGKLDKTSKRNKPPWKS